MYKKLIPSFLIFFSVSFAQAQEPTEELIRQVEMGNRPAQRNLKKFADTLYENQNYKEAFRWYEKLAHLRVDTAQYKLGVMYEKGEGVPQDYRRAAFWYEQAIKHWHEKALFRLGLLYLNGQGVKKDEKRAFKLIRHAARSHPHFVEARNQLGGMYENGIGVKENHVRAFFWYQRAADKDYEPAKENAIRMQQEGKNVYSSIYKMLYKFMEYRAKKGSASAQFDLALMNFYDYDYENSVYWYTQAAEQGDTDAQFRLAFMHLFGRGTKQSDTEALRWLERAKDKNSFAEKFIQEIKQKMNSKSKDSGNDSSSGCPDAFATT